MDFYHVSKYDIADGTSLVDGKIMYQMDTGVINY
jgi:hypothetical protein